VQLLWAAPQGDLLAEAELAASNAEAVVLVLGLTPRLEGEEMSVDLPGFNGGDRTTLKLPDSQETLLRRIAALGKPTVLVLLNGSAVAVNWADEHVPAILEAWYPGQAAGTAIADVLFGDYNPAGRLPVTFYRSVDDLPAFDDYSMIGRTYRFFEGDVLYPFGHGLSYTSFNYSNLSIDASSISDGEMIVVSADVSNTGDRPGEEVVQMYVSWPDSQIDRPIRELRGFQRIALDVGESAAVSFSLRADDLRFWDSENDRWALEAGQIQVQLGASSQDIRLRQSIIAEGDQ
jgi:beta-glucosidase